jgi:hypothetical protein
MSWKEKLETTRESLSDTPDLAIVFSEGCGASEEFIAALQGQFPFIGADYLDFLRETDGVQIDMYQLFGSGRSRFASISDALNRWKPVLGDAGIPIGEDPSGDCIVLTRSGTVVLMDYQKDNVAQGRILAESFGDFLADVLMGKRFPSLFPREWTTKHENEWTRHMRRHGWL